VADLHFERIRPGKFNKHFFEENIFKKIFNLNSHFNIEVVILHGLMYVCYGRLCARDNHCDVEVYNPKTNTWALLEFCIIYRGNFSGALVIDRPPRFLMN